MIGVVGPKDSIESVLRVAEMVGFDSPIQARSYQRIEQAGLVARAIASTSEYILFTGRVAYLLAQPAKDIAVPLDYVDYTAADIVRALFMAKQWSKGTLPPFSIDVFDPLLVRSTCADLGLEVPKHLFFISDDEIGSEPELLNVVADFHRQAWSSGDVGLCLTCLGSVFTSLVSQNIPALRIVHTHSSIRAALDRAREAIKLARSHSAHIVVALIELESAGPHEEMLRQLTRNFRGTLTSRGHRTLVIHMTLGALQVELGRGNKGRRLLNILHQLSASIGFGMGITAVAAEDNARRAIQLSQREQEGIYVVLPDGTARHLLNDSVVRMRELSPELVVLAKRLGVGILSFGRLVAALTRLDASQVTARDLSIAYGVFPRTARRILATFEQNGFASKVGVEQGPGPGRPQLVYRLDLQRLVSHDGASSSLAGAGEIRPMLQVGSIY